MSTIDDIAGSRRGAIQHRVRGERQASLPVARLIGPTELGEQLKPFVLLDLIDHQGPPFEAEAHSHSGIATLTYVADGLISYVDTNGEAGLLEPGGVEWALAGKGMWHAGGLGQAERTRGFQLWLALAPDLELSPSVSRYIEAGQIPSDGPCRVLLGRYGSARSDIQFSGSVNYLAVTLAAGQTWTYEKPAAHKVVWAAVLDGALTSPGEAADGELVVIDPALDAIPFRAATDCHFVVASAAPHPHDLVHGGFSIHTSAENLATSAEYIRSIRGVLGEASAAP